MTITLLRQAVLAVAVVALSGPVQIATGHAEDFSAAHPFRDGTSGILNMDGYIKIFCN